MLGFDGDLVQNLKLLDSTSKLSGRSKPMTLFDRIGSFIKGVYNPVTIWHTAYVQNNLNQAPKP